MKRAALALLSCASVGCGPEVRTLERDGLSIHHFPLGLANVWVVDVQSGGTLMVDTAGKSDGDDILASLEVAKVAKNAIDLVAITHGHLDHAGSGAEMQRELGAPIALHAADEKMARDGDSPVPEAQNLEGALVKPFLDTQFPAFEPDLLFGESTRLDAFGIAGEVLHLPAHTPGTIAVVLDTGDAFVGDLVRGVEEDARGENEGRCETHLFSEDHEADRAAMETLLARGVTMFLPGHGPMFDADTVRGWLERTQTTSDEREHKLTDLD